MPPCTPPQQYIEANYPTVTFAQHSLRAALKKGVETGMLEKVKASYKLTEKAKAPPPKKPAAKKPAAKKPAAKKVRPPPRLCASPRVSHQRPTAPRRFLTPAQPAAKKPAAKKTKKPAAAKKVGWSV